MNDPLLKKIRNLSILKGDFVLASGEKSSFFFDLKKTMLDPEGAKLIARAILEIPEIYMCNAVGGVATGGIPIMATVSMLSHEVYTQENGAREGIPGFYIRSSRKDHGTRSIIEGHFQAGWTVVLIEDVVSTGKSVLQAIETVREHGGTVKTVVAVVDRLQGGRELLEANGINLISLYTKTDFIEMN